MMEVIPAIDIIGGQCVRLEKGDYDKKTAYHDDPLQVALDFEKAGIQRLHLVDLDGAKAQQPVNLNVLEAITKSTNLTVDFGGGVKNIQALNAVFEAGASQVTGGSIAAKNKDEFLNWLKLHGSEKIILGADVLNEMIMVSGWQESTSIPLFEFLDFYIAAGVRYVICTDISKDGMLSGPAIDLYRSIIRKYPTIKLIASGGISCMDDLSRLQDTGLYGAIVGKAIYEKRISLSDLTRFISAY